MRERGAPTTIAVPTARSSTGVAAALASVASACRATGTASAAPEGMSARWTFAHRLVLVCLVMGSLARDVRAESTRAVYAELLGKSGLWGLGYDQRLRPWLLVGGVGSFYIVRGQRVISFSPYVEVHVASSGPHAWFVDAGPQLVHTWTPSPVPEWDGQSATGLGGGVSTGYEFRARFVSRVFAHGAVGKGGVLPWIGGGFGWSF